MINTAVRVGYLLLKKQLTRQLYSSEAHYYQFQIPLYISNMMCLDSGW